MELNNIIATIIFIVFLTHFYLIWQYTYFRRRGIPTVKGFIPPLGHMLPVITVQKSIASLCEIFHNQNKEHSMCGYYQFFSPILLIRDPDIVKSVLQTNFTSFGQNPFQLTAQKEDQLLNFNPFFVKGEKWKKARAPLTNSFSANKMKLMLPLFKNVAKKMNDYLHENCTSDNSPYEFDLKELCNKFTGEISSNGMGIEVHNFQDEAKQPKFGEFTYNQLVEKLFQLPSITTEILQRMIFFVPSLAKFLNVSITPKEVDEYFREISKAIVTKRKRENIVCHDFVQFVMDYQRTQDNSVDEELIAAAHMLSFAVDVYETTAITLSFLITDIASGPEIQNKIREEIMTVLDNNNGELTYDALKEMTYFDKVLSESQRMHHILGAYFKICTKRTKLEGNDGLSCVVEPGQTVAFSAAGLQMDPKYWNEPEKFDPERFNEEKSGRHKFVYLPFGEGPRVCVGIRMAVILMKLAVSAIFKDFSVELSPKMIYPLEKDETQFLTFAKGGYWMKIKPL